MNEHERKNDRKRTGRNKRETKNVCDKADEKERMRK